MSGIIPHQAWCQNCEKKFTPNLTTCPACVKDPKRKPRVVILYGAPPIVATMGARVDPRPAAPVQNQKPAGNAQMPLSKVTPAIWAAVQRAMAGYVFFKCQRNLCIQLVARKPTSEGTLPQENQYCSKHCVGMDTGDARKTRVWITCRCGCKRKREVYQWEMKNARGFYWSQKCHYKDRARAAEEKRKKEDGHRHECDTCSSSYRCLKPCDTSKGEKGGICDKCFKALENVHATEKVPGHWSEPKGPKITSSERAVLA